MYQLSFNRPQKQINADDVIGQGNFGCVYRGMWYEIPIAIKVLHTCDVEEEDRVSTSGQRPGFKQTFFSGLVTQ